MPIPEAAPLDTIRKLEDLQLDLAALARRVEVIERAFGMPPPQELHISARPASLLRAKALGLKGGVNLG